MNRKRWLWVFFVFSGVALAAETVDAEILKDLDFFASFDVIQDEAMMVDGIEETIDLDATSNGGEK